jgi:hypothetical protein
MLAQHSKTRENEGFMCETTDLLHPSSPTATSAVWRMNQCAHVCCFRKTTQRARFIYSLIRIIVKGRETWLTIMRHGDFFL